VLSGNVSLTLYISFRKSLSMPYHSGISLIALK
jgi:hypothetical protein